MVGIETEKRNAVRVTLDGLLTFKDDGKFKPLITGYSWFDKVQPADRVVALSHSHRAAEYKYAMLAYLEETLDIPAIALEAKIRNKGSAYHWRPDYFHRDEAGKLYLGKMIMDLRTGRHVDLDRYSARTLAESDDFKDADYCLISEDTSEWQIDMPFSDESELLNLLVAFVNKAYSSNAKHWPGADRIPLLIIGDAAQSYAKHPLVKKHFSPANRVYLAENDNEFSFIIESDARLECLKPHGSLHRLGFISEPCLVNIPFALEALKVA